MSKNERNHSQIKNTPKPNANSIKITVTKLTKTHAFLVSPELGEIKWPLTHFPPDFQPGHSLLLNLHPQDQFEQLRQLLEELIN